MPLQVTGQFIANGNSNAYTAISDAPELGAKVNVSISGLTGTGATVTVQRSFDGGNTWKVVQPYTLDTEAYATEPSADVQYRLVCSGYTGGTIAYEFGC